MNTHSTVIPLRRGANRIDDAMMDGHLRRTGHTLVAYRIITNGIGVLRRTCCSSLGER